MKILDIIRTHYGSKFYLTFSQDEEVTVFEIGSTPQCNDNTFIVSNDVANGLVKLLSKEDTSGNSTNPNKKVFNVAECNFAQSCGRWEITGHYTIEFETKFIIYV